MCIYITFETEGGQNIIEMRQYMATGTSVLKLLC